MPERKVTSDDAAPRAAVAEVPSSTEAKTPTAQLAKTKWRNIGNTLLTLDDGAQFPRNTVAELSPAEVERFQQAERNGRLIAPVGGK